MSVNPISPAVFQGGQMTDLPVFSGTLDGTELMEIVAAPAGETNEAAGVNYQITTQLLSLLITEVALTTTIIANGQYTSPASPYRPAADVARIYINKTNAEPTYITFNAASTYYFEPLVQDITGNAGPGAVTTVAFSNSEQANGNSTVPIQTPYGGYFFRRIPTLNTWTLGSA